MFELVGSKIGNIRGKLGIVIAELGQLLAIMLVDLGLDRVGAGQRGFLRHKRARSAEREPCNVPQRLERGRTNAAIGHQRVEALKVALFLGRHARDQLGFGQLRRSTANWPA